ncbi:MAG: acyl carrier protein [Chloroflexi bacterium]|nr:acyl carrier protein [Chloroflexota bacterium]
MRTVLQDQTIDGDSNFFLYGGNSILAAMLADEIELSCGTPIRIQAILENPSATELAAMLVRTEA